VRLRPVLLALFLAIFVWSMIRPHDWITWGLEVFPAVIGLVLMIATHRRFPLTPLLVVLLFLHAVLLVVGGHYTYAMVPLGFWFQDAFDLTRNHYDRLGHFAQGFVPAILAREILIRKNVVRGRAWLFAIVVAFCLGFSALYELLEWLVGAYGGDEGVAFLATQGDEWDTQKDMALALVGAVAAQLLLGRVHDRQIARVGTGG
jgi:putative membrane protein